MRIVIACSRLTDVVRQHTDQGRPTAEAAIAPLGGNGDGDCDGDGCVAEDKLVAASAEARDVGLPGERAAGVIRGPKPGRSADVDVPVPVAHECLVGLDCELLRSHVYVRIAQCYAFIRHKEEQTDTGGQTYIPFAFRLCVCTLCVCEEGTRPVGGEKSKSIEPNSVPSSR